MLEIIIAIVLILIALRLWTWRKNKVYIRQCPPGVLLTYKKVAGGSGLIYELDIRTDGKYIIYVVQGKQIRPMRYGTLNTAQFNAYKRLLYNPPKSCLYTNTIADSMITELIYRRPDGDKIVYLGVLDEHALPRGVFNDVVTLDKILNVVA